MQPNTAEVLRLRATSAVSRDKSVRRCAQDDDFVGVLTKKNILSKLALMGHSPGCHNHSPSQPVLTQTLQPLTTSFLIVHGGLLCIFSSLSCHRTHQDQDDRAGNLKQNNLADRFRSIEAIEAHVHLVQPQAVGEQAVHRQETGAIERNKTGHIS
jgi:hypothetical protein